MSRAIEPVGNKARTFEEAARWEREQNWSLTPLERLEILRELQLRVFGTDAPDVRESQRLESR